VIVKMIVEKQMDCRLEMETQVLGENLLKRHFVHHESHTTRPRFEPGPRHVGFVVDKVAFGQVFSENFGFPCRSSFHQFIHNHHHLSSGAGTVGQ
jgi:hypothetical protein